MKQNKQKYQSLLNKSILIDVPWHVDNDIHEFHPRTNTRELLFSNLNHSRRIVNAVRLGLLTGRGKVRQLKIASIARFKIEMRKRACKW